MNMKMFLDLILFGYILNGEYNNIKILLVYTRVVEI